MLHSVTWPQTLAEKTRLSLNIASSGPSIIYKDMMRSSRPQKFLSSSSEMSSFQMHTQQYQNSLCGNVAVLFLSAKYGEMCLYQLVLQSVGRLARTGFLIWNNIIWGVTSFPAPTSNFQQMGHSKKSQWGVWGPELKFCGQRHLFCLEPGGSQLKVVGVGFSSAEELRSSTRGNAPIKQCKRHVYISITKIYLY